MLYKESVDWLFNQFPAYQNIGISAYKPDLDNIYYLCDLFEINYSHLKFVHVAGTNGKGSTCNYLASILQESEYRTGLFTSPHIEDFRERIRVNGIMISEVEVIDFCALIKKTPLDIKPSFFEITWMLALKHFIANECEICIIEVGLGGRLDATNIISPILSIITNISLDHTSILGNSLEKIAFEKAGIMKPNVPCIIGSNQINILSIFQDKATLLPCPIIFTDELIIDSIFQKGSYAYKNELTVREAIRQLNIIGFSISNEMIENGFKNVKQNTGFKGRFDILSTKPFLIADAAHNSDGITQLLSSISLIQYDKLWIIYGASNDKDVDEILDLFPKECQIILCEFNNSRSLNQKQLSKLSANLIQKNEIFPNIKQALTYCQQIVNESDIILVCGSFFLLSDFFSYFSQKDL